MTRTNTQNQTAGYIWLALTQLLQQLRYHS